MKTNIKRIQEFVNASKIYLQSEKEETKFKYAIKKVLIRLQPCFDEYHELKEDIELEHANTNEHGSVLYKIEGGARVYEFTKNQLKAVQKKLKALLYEERFEFQEYIAQEIPDTIHAELLPYFEGFITEDTNEQSAS